MTKYFPHTRDTCWKLHNILRFFSLIRRNKIWKLLVVEINSENKAVRLYSAFKTKICLGFNNKNKLNFFSSIDLTKISCISGVISYANML